LDSNKISSTNHSAPEKEDMLSYWLAKSLRSITSGSIQLHVSDKPALKIEAIDNKNKNKKINIDFLEPELFSFDIKPENSVEENPSFFHKLINAFDLTKIITDKDDMILSFSKKFAHYLTINDVTLSISRKGKEAITIGKEAKPTLSRLLTRSDDVQIKSTMEATKLTDDVLTEEQDYENSRRLNDFISLVMHHQDLKNLQAPEDQEQ
jgi:hypothetical protein